MSKFTTEQSHVMNSMLLQLGGRKFIAMTGAKNFVFDTKNNSLVMDIGKNKSKANKMRLTLMPNDTYTMDFLQFKPKTFDMVTVSSHPGLYNEMLPDIFTKETGLHTSL